MNLVEVTARFYASEAASQDLLKATSDEIQVSYNATDSIAEVRLSLTDEGDLFDQLPDALHRVKTLARPVQEQHGEDFWLVGLSVQGEELVAIGGNYHLRGLPIPIS